MIKKKLMASMMALAAAGMMTACSPGKTETTAAAVTKEETAMQETTTEPEKAAEPETTLAQTAEPETEKTAEEAESGGKEAAEEQAASLEELAGMLGMKDSETADLFGGGEENWTEDRKFYIGRIYEVQLYDEMFPVYTSCDNDKKVNSVSVWISNGEREVTEEEAKEWAERITSSTGVEPTFDGKTSEAGSQNWKWVCDGKIITMHWLGNLLSVNMNPAVGELK